MIEFCDILPTLENELRHKTKSKGFRMANIRNI